MAATVQKKARGAGWTPSMSDEAVKAKTGRNWMGWFVILNKANAGTMPHKEIATLLHDKYGCPGWWSQMITVEYERARGGRKRNETATGFSVSVSKTLAAPLAKLFAAAADDTTRKAWFPKGAFVKSSETKDKYFRGSWGKDGSRLEINFYTKGAGKSQINVQVNKLPREELVESERAAWKKALEKLNSVLAP